MERGNRETKILDLVIKEIVANGGMIKVLTWDRIYKRQGCIFYGMGINISDMEDDSDDVDSNLMSDGVMEKMSESLRSPFLV